MMTLTNQHRGDAAANSSTDDESSLMPVCVQLLDHFFVSMCWSATWGCPFFCFWSPNSGMSQIWEGFSPQWQRLWVRTKSVIRKYKNKNAKKQNNRDLQQFNPAKIKAYTVPALGNQSYDNLPSKILAQESHLNQTGKRSRAECSHYRGIIYSVCQARCITELWMTECIMAVYNAMVLPTLVYGYEAWTLQKRYESKLQALEMRYLSRVRETRLDTVT